MYRVDLTRPVINVEHGKAVEFHPALAAPRQADRKAGPGETALTPVNEKETGEVPTVSDLCGCHADPTRHTQV